MTRGHFMPRRQRVPVLVGLAATSTALVAAAVAIALMWSTISDNRTRIGKLRDGENALQEQVRLLCPTSPDPSHCQPVTAAPPATTAPTTAPRQTTPTAPATRAAGGRTTPTTTTTIPSRPGPAPTTTAPAPPPPATTTTRPKHRHCTSVPVLGCVIGDTS